LVAHLLGERGIVTEILLADDDRHLYSASDRGTACMWRVDREMAALQSRIRENRYVAPLDEDKWYF
jgi:hypothetical protein